VNAALEVAQKFALSRMSVDARDRSTASGPFDDASI
jgi:hypothetical protein